jgi:hypothetical protein
MDGGGGLFAPPHSRNLLFANLHNPQMERQAKGSMVFIGSMSGSIVNVPQPQA